MKHTTPIVNIQPRTASLESFGAYLDCNATAPLEPAVQALMVQYFTEELGNAGSRTHEYGLRAKRAVEQAREQVAAVVACKSDEVVFTSGATESNNIALLGLAAHADNAGKRHIVSTAIEHKAVLEVLEVLANRGFEITLIKPNRGGFIDPAELKAALRPDTLAVSVMHVNNETGVRQPISEIARVLDGHDAFFHVDAAQGFGKAIDDLRDTRIDFISVSSHKIYGPAGVGVLITRKRGFKRPPLTPLIYGGGQERALRPGTLPVPLVAGLGLAAELACKDSVKRAKECVRIRQKAMDTLAPLNPQIHGDPERILPHVLNFSIAGLDSEAVMVALKGLIAISNGSACTSQDYSPSHVLKAMSLKDEEIEGALRLSWCHLTKDIPWSAIADRIQALT